MTLILFQLDFRFDLKVVDDRGWRIEMMMCQWWCHDNLVISSGHFVAISLMHVIYTDYDF